MCTLFRDNAALCNEVTERVVQHFVRCIETHGRHMQYLKFLQTIVKSENTYIRKCQDMVMSEVTHGTLTQVYLCYWWHAKGFQGNLLQFYFDRLGALS